MGNKNALKHGYYTRHFTEREIADFEEMREQSLVGELLLARTLLGRHMAYVSREGATQEELERVTPLILSSLSKVVQIYQNIDEDAVDWDEILDEVGKGWSMPI